MEGVEEILFVPAFGQGHLFPSMELCKHLSTRNFSVTLVIPSHVSSSVPVSFRDHPRLQVVEIVSTAPMSPPPPPPVVGAGNGNGLKTEQGSNPLEHGPRRHHTQMVEGIESYLSNRPGKRPVCAVTDVMASWSKESFEKFGIPVASFMTSGACMAAIDNAIWKTHAEDLKPGETRFLPGLSDEMALTYPDLKGVRSRKMRDKLMEGNGAGGPPFRFGPPGPGPHGSDAQQPMWLYEVDRTIAVLINTCDNIERQFIDYVASQVNMPVWGVGPLLPEKYWKSAGSLIHDREIRSNRKSNYTEDEVFQWLDAKPRGSVIYISFGSEVGPTMEEYPQLANALEESNHPFIWVIQPGSGKKRPPPHLLAGQPPHLVATEEEGYDPKGLDSKVGNRGLIIRGWAPQLLILSHPSTGGFLSHCGWNSTVEAIGRGVPFLAWPIRGDQFHIAKVVVCHLKVGHMMSTYEGPEESVWKDEIVAGIEKLMSDEVVHKQALSLRSKFDLGFPATSVAGLDAFVDLLKQRAG